MYTAAPMMGVRMDIAEMLGSMLGNSWAAGLAAHVMNGAIVFPMLFAAVLFMRRSGSPVVRGVTWGAILWLVAQVVVMPMMGAGFFSVASGGAMAAVASLMGKHPRGDCGRTDSDHGQCPDPALQIRCMDSERSSDVTPSSGRAPLGDPRKLLRRASVVGVGFGRRTAVRSTGLRRDYRGLVPTSSALGTGPARRRRR